MARSKVTIAARRTAATSTRREASSSSAPSVKMVPETNRTSPG